MFGFKNPILDFPEEMHPKKWFICFQEPLCNDPLTYKPECFRTFNVVIIVFLSGNKSSHVAQNGNNVIVS